MRCTRTDTIIWLQDAVRQAVVQKLPVRNLRLFGQLHDGGPREQLSRVHPLVGDARREGAPAAQRRRRLDGVRGARE